MLHTMQHKPYKAIVNGHLEYENLKHHELDAIPTGERTWHILDAPRSFHAEVLAEDAANKHFVIRVNGNIYEIQLQDAIDQLVASLGLTRKKVHRIKDIKAPMPGLVRRIDVQPGQEIQEGDAVLVLEAMKMENVLKSPGAGTVKKILVEPGSSVTKGQVMLMLE